MLVLDSIHENGAKLVRMSAGQALHLRADYPGIRLVPVVYYTPAVAPRQKVELPPKTSRRASGLNVIVTIMSKMDRHPVQGAEVVAFNDFKSKIGAQGTTDHRGRVALPLGGSTTPLDRLYVYPPRGLWGILRKRVSIVTGCEVLLKSIDLTLPDALRHFYGVAPDGAGKGVIVGVIDTGIDGSHPDLRVAGGANTVMGEDTSDFGDNGEHHGTHVAGIIAAAGKPPKGLRGVAPDVTLRSYRVFGKDVGKATSYAIAKAIDRAVADKCDLVNMSLGGGNPDAVTRAAIEDARAQGTVVVVATGNDYRSQVSFPASESLSVAVSAMGRKGTFPSDSTESGDIANPYGKDRRDFVAAFSNVGREVDLMGPGVGILSTVPGGYAPMSGTSMACPAVTGVAARLLAASPGLLAMRRDAARADAIIRTLYGSAVPMGFGLEYEGHGLPGKELGR